MTRNVVPNQSNKEMNPVEKQGRNATFSSRVALKWNSDSILK